MHRRMLLALPLLTAIPGRVWAARTPDVSSIQEVSELRLGSAQPGAPALALEARLNIPVRAVRLSPGALVRALNEGHLEAAILDRTSFGHARRLMGGRLMVIAGGAMPLVTRTALPNPLRTAIANALTA